MTPYDPQAIAREAAEKIVALTGYGHALHVNDILPDILTAAARMVAESGAREALDSSLPTLQEVYDNEQSFWGSEDKHGIARDAREARDRCRAALAALAKLEGRG